MVLHIGCLTWIFGLSWFSAAGYFQILGCHPKKCRRRCEWLQFVLVWHKVATVFDDVTCIGTPQFLRCSLIIVYHLQGKGCHHLPAFWGMHSSHLQWVLALARGANLRWWSRKSPWCLASFGESSRQCWFILRLRLSLSPWSKMQHCGIFCSKSAR